MTLCRHVAGLAAGLALATLAAQAQAFCGFYVAKADASLFNKASQVILARDGARTTITMQNDYQGDPREFALVVPVPVVLKEGDVKVVDNRVFERLDGFSTPRLVEYHDPDPCAPQSMVLLSMQRMSLATADAAASRSDAARARTLGVTIESSFTVGEYEILILSAKQSDGLETWLTENGYRLPAGAAGALKPYVRQDMKFFVAKVKLAATGSGYGKLRPLQFSYESPRFMLPMRLGMLNADGPQDLIIFALTRNGRVEASNYRTVRIPTNVELPVELRANGLFTSFYQRLFDRATAGEAFKAVFTEFAWDMSWCDPCAGDPLTNGEMLEAGAFWVASAQGPSAVLSRPAVLPGTMLPRGNAVLTRLHLRYTPSSFPEDLVLHETGDRQPFQARYVLRHANPVGTNACPEAASYLASVKSRQEIERRVLLNLTGASLDALRDDATPRATPRKPR